MSSRLRAWMVAAGTLLLTGCCCCDNWCDCCNVPVDFEDLCHSMHHDNCECAHCYPYSCPPCPYYNYQNCSWQRPVFCPRQQVEVVTQIAPAESMPAQSNGMENVPPNPTPGY